MKFHAPVLSALLLGALALPAAAEDSSYVFSPVGPGAGHGAIGLGGKLHMVVPTSYIPVPTFDLNYVRGFTENLDLRFTLDSLIVANYADLGLRLHFGSPEFSFGINAGLTTIFMVIGGKDGGGAAVAVAGTPGAFIGFGSRSVQVSVGADVPMFFATGAIANLGGSSNSAGLSGFALTVRPSIAVEFPVSGSTNLYIQGSAMIIPDASFAVGPMLAVGAAF
ncbi:MAG: hypothetical protein U1E65_02170 [Myxococcota bacterium]